MDAETRDRFEALELRLSEMHAAATSASLAFAELRTELRDGLAGIERGMLRMAETLSELALLLARHLGDHGQGAA